MCQATLKSTVPELQALSSQTKKADDLLFYLKSKALQTFSAILKKSFDTLVVIMAA